MVLSSERRVSEAQALLARGLPALVQANERARALLLLGDLEHELKRDADALERFEQLRRRAADAHRGRLANERLAHVTPPAPDHVH